VSTHVRSLRVTAPVPELVAGTVLSPHAANVAPTSTTTALHRNIVWRSSDPRFRIIFRRCPPYRGGQWRVNGRITGAACLLLHILRFSGRTW
jgi:hypothetical protein